MSKPVQITCGTCAAEVVVEKFSWHHTRVQWNAEALSTCTTLKGPDTATHNITAMRDCSRLRVAIRHASIEGAFGDLD